MKKRVYFVLVAIVAMPLVVVSAAHRDTHDDVKRYFLNQAFFTAIRAQNIDDVRRLLAEGADVNAQDEIADRTALMCAAEERGNLPIVRLLVERGARLDTKTLMGSWNVACSAASSQDPEIVAYILGLGVNPQVKKNLNAVKYARTQAVKDVFIQYDAQRVKSTFREHARNLLVIYKRQNMLPHLARRMAQENARQLTRDAYSFLPQAFVDKCIDEIVGK